MDFCYFIPQSGYDDLNDYEGRWKYNTETEDYEHYYPRDDNGNYTKILDKEFHIGVDIESGGWGIEGDIQLFMDWAEAEGVDLSCLHDEIPELEDEEDW